jgi:polysaccharide biosynthesis transport protein
MSTPARPIVNFSQIKTNLRNHSLLWVIPTIVCTTLAISYAVVKSNKWKATQVVQIRSTSNDAAAPPQAFSPEAMKVAQENVVNAAKSMTVIEAALREIGPINGGNDPAWPDKSDVESSITKVTVAPPKGSEFGKTDLVYISAEAKTPQRAEAFTAAVVKHVERKIQEQRAQTEKSRIAEYTQTKAVAQQKLNTETAKLQKMEREVGIGLAELRSLGDGKTMGNTNLDRIKKDISTNREKLDANQQRLALLIQAQNDPDRIDKVPTELLEKSNLKKMKEGLIEAQIRTANLIGNKTLQHPEVQAAQLVENKIRQQFATELNGLVNGFKSDIVINQNEIAKLELEKQQEDERTSKLGAIRAEYQNLESAMKFASENLSRETRNLSTAEANLAAAFSTSVLIKQSLTDVGTTSIGPSGIMIVAGGLFGGLILGLSLVFITVPIGQAWGRRWSDYMGAGRRSSDQQRGASPTGATRRASDAAAAATRRSTDQTTGDRRASNQPAADRRATDATSLLKSLTPPQQPTAENGNKA